ncbi:hypothetical protein VC82_137 [Flagellimonas lutaonensis]|uniref:Uncharacterized protein n=1 Tax=Flagellimonas lutaonensis TaxID=516051 RepID=A0A0D5YPG0_9FLAO|nr:hypothetical protein VC82_137 [Allomuricauda lutaonensis]
MPVSANMKKLLLIISLFYYLTSFSQENRVPSIVVLSPQETITDKGLDSIAQMYKREQKLTEEHKQRVRESNGENFELKSEKEILFMEKMDLGSQITFGLNFYFSYKLFEYHENHMVYPAHEANNSTKSELKKIAEKHDMNWVVNIPKVEFSKNDNGISGEIRYQLYNLKFDEIVLDVDKPGKVTHLRRMKVTSVNELLRFDLSVG